REMIRRPHYRGQVIEKNILGALDGGFGIPGAQNATKLMTRFNPRTPALVSRLAHTNFTIDRGWDGGLFSDLEEGERAGLFPGSEQTDLSPLTFLPTAGENAFYSMLPGMGYVPLWTLDMIVGSVHDPVEEPLEYQNLIDNVGDIVGGAHFGVSNPGLSMMQRVLGGGTFGQVTEAVLDVQRLFDLGEAPPFVSTALGQPDREIDRGRYASAIFADQAEWDEILNIQDEEVLNLYIDRIAQEADEAAAGANLAEQITRFGLPANNKYSGELDVIWDVWLDAGTNNTVLGDPNFDPEQASPDERRRYANEARRKFFELPAWHRDALIVENPAMAVNLVSSWTWTDLAYSANVPGTEVAYRTAGDRESLARHQIYVNEGYIRPLAPQERIRRIVGLVLNARESTAKGVYRGVAANINEGLWEQVVSDEDKAL
ncbi:MAG: hypothetical protein GWO44_12695, partial [Thermoplasmata archaeon]|nr:hypothetical protein [Thermoplasmata archaeon]NIY04085.1 hypothetical protein [Thermoplasmata archaeon]